MFIFIGWEVVLRIWCIECGNWTRANGFFFQFLRMMLIKIFSSPVTLIFIYLFQLVVFFFFGIWLVVLYVKGWDIIVWPTPAYKNVNLITSFSSKLVPWLSFLGDYFVFWSQQWYLHNHIHVGLCDLTRCIVLIHFVNMF